VAQVVGHLSNEHNSGALPVCFYLFSFLLWFFPLVTMAAVTCNGTVDLACRLLLINIYFSSGHSGQLKKT
jgi:hypothetical protein